MICVPERACVSLCERGTDCQVGERGRPVVDLVVGGDLEGGRPRATGRGMRERRVGECGRVW